MGGVWGKSGEVWKREEHRGYNREGEVSSMRSCCSSSCLLPPAFPLSQSALALGLIGLHYFLVLASSMALTCPAPATMHTL